MFPNCTSIIICRMPHEISAVLEKSRLVKSRLLREMFFEDDLPFPTMEYVTQRLHAWNVSLHVA